MLALYVEAALAPALPTILCAFEVTCIDFAFLLTLSSAFMHWTVWPMAVDFVSERSLRQRIKLTETWLRRSEVRDFVCMIAKLQLLVISACNIFLPWWVVSPFLGYVVWQSLRSIFCSAKTCTCSTDLNCLNCLNEDIGDDLAEPPYFCLATPARSSTVNGNELEDASLPSRTRKA